MKPLAELQPHVAGLLTRYVRGPQEDKREVASELARAMLQARQHFYTADGARDLEGHSWEYRQWLKETYSDLGLTPKEINRALSAGRQRINEVFYDIVPEMVADDLERDVRSSADRKRDVRTARQRTDELLTAVRSPDTPDEALKVAQLILRLAGQLETYLSLAAEAGHEQDPKLYDYLEQLQELPEDFREAAAEALDAQMKALEARRLRFSSADE